MFKSLLKKCFPTNPWLGSTWDHWRLKLGIKFGSWNNPHVNVYRLPAPSKRCSLKCKSLLNGTSDHSFGMYIFSMYADLFKDLIYLQSFWDAGHLRWALLQCTANNHLSTFSMSGDKSTVSGITIEMYHCNVFQVYKHVKPKKILSVSCWMFHAFSKAKKTKPAPENWKPSLDFWVANGNVDIVGTSDGQVGTANPHVWPRYSFIGINPA